MWGAVGVHMRDGPDRLRFSANGPLIRNNMQQFLSSTHDPGALLKRLQEDVGFELKLGHPDSLIRDAMDLLRAMSDVDLDDCKAWYDGYRVAGTRGAEIEAYCPTR